MPSCVPTRCWSSRTRPGTHGSPINPLVAGDPGIRFYAGAPIRAESGQPLGTLCVIDRKPRALDTAGRRFLQNLATNAASMLELHRKNRMLTAETVLDPRTGLANRLVFHAALAAACAGASRGTPFGLVTIDLDHFKQVNDQLGHAAGDRMLRDVANRLALVVRAADLVARLGGDEFAIIAAGPVDLAGLRSMASRILDVFARDMHAGRSPAAPIRASIGVALAPLHGASPPGIAHAADAALYSAKRAGRQAFAVADQSTSCLRIFLSRLRASTGAAHATTSGSLSSR